jgi:hypothetical protein
MTTELPWAGFEQYPRSTRGHREQLRVFIYMEKFYNPRTKPDLYSVCSAPSFVGSKKEKELSPSWRVASCQGAID